MKKVVIYGYGPDYTSLADAVEHAANQLRMRTPSENCAWEDKSRVDFTVENISDEEYDEIYGD